MHILRKVYKTGLLIIGSVTMSACNDNDNNNKAQLHEKYTADTYNTIKPQGSTLAEQLNGTWIMLGQGQQSNDESSIIAGKARLEESYNAEFAIREVIRINYNPESNSYTFTGCDGQGQRPLILSNQQVASTTYGPQSLEMKLNIGDIENISAKIMASETSSNTRKSSYQLNAKFYKLKQNNFGSFSFKGEAIDAQWQQALTEKDDYIAQCFVELQGKFTETRHKFAQTDSAYKQSGNIHTLGIEGPLHTADTNLYVDFSLASRNSSPLKARAGSNVYANNKDADSVWEVAYDNWHVDQNGTQQPNIHWQFSQSDTPKQLNAQFDAAIGTEQAFSAALKLRI